jgi:CTP synthase
MNPKTKSPVIHLQEAQKKVTHKGGTMRLGAYPCTIAKDTLAWSAYHRSEVSERHRHRFEFNNTYLDQFNAKGMVPSGINPESKLVEIVEIKGHPWFIGVQFHPEYKSTVDNPHPLFISFVQAALGHSAKHGNAEKLRNAVTE